MKKLLLITFISFICLPIIACTPRGQDESSLKLPDNQVVSLIKNFAKKLGVEYSDIKVEDIEIVSLSDEDGSAPIISGYSVQNSGILPDDLPNFIEIFDGWHVEYIGDSIGGSMTEYTKDNEICYEYLFYDQKIPDELMTWEGDYDSDEYNKARDEFSKTITYNVELVCGFAPDGVFWYQDNYFDAFGQEPFWSAYFRGNVINRFDSEKSDYYYIKDMKTSGDSIIFDGYEISGKLIKQDCIDGGKGDTHEYKIELVRGGDMVYMGCADKYYTDFMVGEEGTLLNFVKKTNYQYKGNLKRDKVSYSIVDMSKDYIYVTLFEINDDSYDQIQLILEKVGDRWQTLYEGDYEVDDETCEELNQYDHDLMEMFFLINCPRG